MNHSLWSQAWTICFNEPPSDPDARKIWETLLKSKSVSWNSRYLFRLNLNVIFTSKSNFHSQKSSPSLIFIYLSIYLFIYLFIYLALLGLSCGTQDIFSCSMWDLFFFFSCCMWILSCGMRDLVPWPGIESSPPVLGVQRLSHWTTKEVPPSLLNFQKILLAETC